MSEKKKKKKKGKKKVHTDPQTPPSGFTGVDYVKGSRKNFISTFPKLPMGHSCPSQGMLSIE